MSFGFYPGFRDRFVLWAGTGSIVFDAAVLVFSIATMWRIFTKAGEKGWKCLIPFYNIYIQCKIAWEGSKFWVILIIPLAVGMVTSVVPWMGQGGFVFALSAALACCVYLIVILVKLCIRMAHRFNKSTAFGVVGLFMFSLIGYIILAWGSADYNEDRDLGDGIWHQDA